MFLRQSTASQVIELGPFVDDTDFKTAEPSLTISNTDIKLRKHGTTSHVSKNSGGASHISNGYYHATLNATDTNTIGLMEVHVNVAGALPVWTRFQVVEEAVYDALFNDGAPAYNGAQVVASVTGAVGSVTGAVGSVTGNVGGNVTGSVGSLAAQAKADVNAEVDSALNTAIPGSPTANSINERVAAIDNKLPAGNLSDVTTAQVNAEVVDALTIDLVPDAVPADGSRPTIAQALYMLTQFLMERSITGTTMTVRKPDGSTTLMTFSLDSTDPTSVTRG
jgi:hypothetical protein